MKNLTLFLIFICFLSNNINAQESYSKDSIKNNLGVIIFWDRGYNANIDFIELGLDYNHRFDKRFSLGLTSSYAHLDNDKIFQISPYLRTDLLIKRLSPFLDFGLGFKRLTLKEDIEYYSGYQFKTHYYDHFFIASRFGFYFINKKYFSSAFFCIIK